jgi:glucose uptake protein
MLLPISSTGALVALLIALFGLGSWAILYKVGKKIRFEYFGYDFAWGVLLAAIIAAFTLGSWNSGELTFQDNYLLAGYRNMAWVLVSGMLLALANLTLLGATAVSGIAISFPVAFGIGWALVGVFEYFTRSGVNAMLLFGGAAVTVLAAILNMVAYNWFLKDREHQALEALRADPRAKGAVHPASGLKAYALAMIAGIVLAGFYAALAQGVTGDTGVASYGAALILAGGVFGATIVIVPFFLNFPVRGKPLTVRQYFKIDMRNHVLGLVGGIVWLAGILALLVSMGLPSALQPVPVVTFLLGRGAPLLAGLWGMFVFREYAGAPAKVTTIAFAALVVLAGGMAMMAVAPVYGK